MSYAAPVTKLKYFDEANGWTDRKPGTIAPPNVKNVMVCNVDLNHSDVADIDRFNEVLAANLPTVAILHNVTPPALLRLKSGVTARRMYSLLETSKAEMHEESTVALFRLGLQCDPTEAPVKPEGKNILRALIQVDIRIAGGPLLTITVLNMERNVTQQRRLVVAGAVLKQTSTADASMLISNVMEGIQHTDDVYREIQSTWLSHGFVDSMDECMEKGLTSPWVMLTRSVKYMAASPTTELLKGNEARCLSCTIAPRPAGAAAGASAGSIAIPMPRSAKSARTKSPTSVSGSTSTQPISGGGVATGQQALADPAILTAEAARSGAAGPKTPSSPPAGPAQPQLTQGNEIIMRLVRQQQQQQQQLQKNKWQLIHSFSLKGSDAKLTSVEGTFDVSNLFATAGDAIDALNSGALSWPADYCVVHNTVLCSLEIPHLDRQSFRRYARDSKNNSALTSQIFAAVSAYSNGVSGASVAAASPPAAAAASNGAAIPAVAAVVGGAGSPLPVTSTSGAGVTAEKPNAWSKPMRAEAEEFSALARGAKREDGAGRREWSEACCTIVYQLTPREFKFNITPVVGLSKDNLKKAIYLLNKGKTGVKDPGNVLQDYPYDYALLFSTERQGYWLIAATHVPCDIVACRMVA